jgi:integrase
MARNLHKLKDVAIRSDRLEPGRHSDGGGLYLNVSASKTKSWLFMWVSNGRRREMGLGAYPTVSLSAARKKAEEYRSFVADGRDPIADRNAAEAVPTFGECADELLASLEPSFRSDKHRAQWKMTLAVYCEPIRENRVSTITTDDVLRILAPIWQEKAETASRLRGRIERVLDFAKTKGWRTGDNPALWRGHLRNVLPQRQKLTRGHHAAMPYRELPNFTERLRAYDATAAKALEFLILTAARSGEVLNAAWSEIDLDEAVWIVPASRMKAGKEHRVPLSDDAMKLLKRLHKEKVSDYVFPGLKANTPLSSSAMDMLMRRMKVSQFTVHGFRSAFRDWAGDETNFPRELAEAALSHRVGDATERAYRRADALEKRRKLMDAWAEFLNSPRGAKVIPIRRQPR